MPTNYTRDHDTVLRRQVESALRSPIGMVDNIFEIEYSSVAEVQMACSMESRTMGVDQVDTYVRSGTKSRFGAGGSKRRPCPPTDSTRTQEWSASTGYPAQFSTPARRTQGQNAHGKTSAELVPLLGSRLCVINQSKSGRSLTIFSAARVICLPRSARSGIQDLAAATPLSSWKRHCNDQLRHRHFRILGPSGFAEQRSPCLVRVAIALLVAASLGLSAACAHDNEAAQTSTTKSSGAQQQLPFSGLKFPVLAVDSSGTVYALDAQDRRVVSLPQGDRARLSYPSVT